MVQLTNDDINEATMIAKNASYKLAYELSLEEGYGGNIDCCINRLKLLWMWTNVISCKRVLVNATATFQITVSVHGTSDILVDGVSIINGPIQTYAILTVSQQMTALTNLINAAQKIYVATFDGVKITITGNCNNPLLTYYFAGGTVVSSSFSGGVCPNLVCVSDSKIKNLIAKIKSICTN